MKKSPKVDKVNDEKTVSLSSFVENPDNPTTATDEDIERLAGKLKRVPLGLTAIRIAYVTDHPAGKCVVLSGNKRLRVLKRIYGEDGEVPAVWFADITAMSEAERHEFIVTANVSDGQWDVDKLLMQYDKGELGELVSADELEKILADVTPTDSGDVERFDDLDNGRVKTDEVIAKIGDIQIPITPDEYEALDRAYKDYVRENTVGYGFFHKMLGMGDGDVH